MLDCAPMFCCFFLINQLTYHSDKMHCLCMGETIVCREKRICLHKRNGDSWCDKGVDQPGHVATLYLVRCCDTATMRSTWWI